MLAALLGTGCGSEGGSDQTVDATKACPDDGGAGPYFVYRSMDWFFHGATDYPDDLRTLGEVEPSLDWFAEYEHYIPGLDDNPTQGASLRSSGHDVALATQRKELVGFQAEDTEIAGRHAYTATGPGGEPTVVGLDVGTDYTVVLLSYGLELRALVAVSRQIEQLCQADWIEAGGQLLDCMPIDPGCVEPTTTATTPSPPPPSTTTTLGR